MKIGMNLGLILGESGTGFGQGLGLSRGIEYLYDFFEVMHAEVMRARFFLGGGCWFLVLRWFGQKVGTVLTESGGWYWTIVGTVLEAFLNGKVWVQGEFHKPKGNLFHLCFYHVQANLLS